MIVSFPLFRVVVGVTLYRPHVTVDAYESMTALVNTTTAPETDFTTRNSPCRLPALSPFHEAFAVFLKIHRSPGEREGAEFSVSETAPADTVLASPPPRALPIEPSHRMRAVAAERSALPAASVTTPPFCTMISVSTGTVIWPKIL